MTINICDDEISTLNFLSSIIKNKFGDKHIITLFSNVETLLSNKAADLLICDIKLGDNNGIEIAKKVIEKSPKTKIIFITGYPQEYFDDIFVGVRPYGCLKKPINTDKLLDYINNAADDLKNFPSLTIKIKNDDIILPLKNILYIESNQRQKIIHTCNESYKVNLSFSKIEPMLTDGFARCHVAYFVNLFYAIALNSDFIVLKNGKSIPISRKYKSEFRRSYFIYKESVNE